MTRKITQDMFCQIQYFLFYIFSVNVSQSTLAKQVAKLVMLVGNCIVLNMESSLMDKCQVIRQLVRKIRNSFLKTR